MREGLRFLWGHRLVRTLTLLGFGVSFTGGAVTGLTVVYGVQALGLPDSGAGIGLLFSAAALGSLASSLLLPALNRRFATGSITLGGLTAAVVAVAALALATNFVAALVFFFGWGAAQTLVIINAISLRQQVAPDHLQSRVNVSARMIAWGGMPFGAAVGGALAQVTSIEVTYLVMALGVGISAAIGWFSPLRYATADSTPLSERSVGARPRSGEQSDVVRHARAGVEDALGARWAVRADDRALAILRVLRDPPEPALAGLRRTAAFLALQHGASLADRPDASRRRSPSSGVQSHTFGES